MNAAQVPATVNRFVPVEVCPITAVIDAYERQGNWSSHLNALAAPQDPPAVEALEGLLDLARSSACADLQQAVEDLLRRFGPWSSGYHEARLVVSPSIDGILHAYDTDQGGAGGARPRWETAIERLAAQGGRDAVEHLAGLLDTPRDGLPAAAKRALLKMQDTADATVHAEINRVLGTAVPYRKAGLPTRGDGNCLIHALLGTTSRNGYGCTLGTVKQVRQALSTTLARHDPEKLPEPIAQVVRGFYEEVLEASDAVMGSDLPNRKALASVAWQLGAHLRAGVTFDQLPGDAKQAVFQACALFVAEPGHYLPCALVPLLAQVTGQAVSLYAEPDGWQHVGQDGRPCAPARDAVAIRFVAHRQHYERVEGPPEEAVPDEPKPRRMSGRDGAHRRPSSSSTGSTLSIEGAPPKASPPRKEGLVARLFSWVGRFFC